ncbi:MAG: hypothetical protein ACREM6_02520 [Vulcanimicrobiaceae bacterium]
MRQWPTPGNNLSEPTRAARVIVADQHSALALLTPIDVHLGRAQERLAQRQLALDAAYAAHPHRFVRGKPKIPQLPTASYINRPAAPAEAKPAA